MTKALNAREVMAELGVGRTRAYELLAKHGYRVDGGPRRIDRARLEELKEEWKSAPKRPTSSAELKRRPTAHQAALAHRNGSPPTGLRLTFPRTKPRKP